MKEKLTRLNAGCLCTALLIAICMSPVSFAEETTENVKRRSLAQKISALSSTMKERLGETFGRSEKADGEPEKSACRCCQSAVCTSDQETQQNNAGATVRQLTSPQHSGSELVGSELAGREDIHRESTGREFRQSLDHVTDRVADQMPDQQVARWERPGTNTASQKVSHEPGDVRSLPNSDPQVYATHSPVHVSKHHPTEAAEFRELFNGDSRTAKAAFYEDNFVGDYGPPKEEHYDADRGSGDFRQEQYYHALPTDADAAGASPALPNPVLAGQNAQSSQYQSSQYSRTPRGHAPPYQGYHLGGRQVTATEHALFLKSENETLKASQRALIAEKKSMRESINYKESLLAKSELAVSSAMEQLKAAERRNAELEQRYAALEKEHERFVRDTDRTLDSIRNELDEVLVSEINATR